jgi:amidase
MASRASIAASAAYDAVLVPTLADLPKRVGELRDDDDPAADFAAQERFNPYSAAYNMTGQPAITLPVHWTAEGVPVGVQLVGPPAGEAVLLTLAAQLEEARPWRDRTPPCW